MDDITKEALEKMNKGIESLQNSLSTLRTGRANAAMLNGIMVDYYGSPTPLNQLSAISIPEPRQILIKPFDKNDIKNVVSAIAASDLGLNPINEGNQIRLNVPPLTEERRRDIAKQAHKYGEEAKVAVRNIRRDYMEVVKIDDSMGKDYQARLEEEIQKVTDESIRKIDVIVADKDKEIMSI